MFFFEFFFLFTGKRFETNPGYLVDFKLEPTPHFVRANFVPFCEEISFSPRVGVVFTNDLKHRLLGPSSVSWRKKSMCTHQAHDGKSDKGLEWKKSDADFGG